MAIQKFIRHLLPRLIIGIVFSGGILSLKSSTAFAETPFVKQVMGQLIDAADALLVAERKDLGLVLIENLSAKSNISHPVTLIAGRTYTIVTVCDANCNDVDVEIYGNGRLVASDTMKDPYPTITFTPRVTDVYSVKVDMYDCRAFSCYYGLGFFTE